MSATQTKPPKSPTPAVEPLSQSQIDRCHRCAEAAATLEAQLIILFEYDAYLASPKPQLFQAIESLLREVASDPDVQWPSTQTPFLASVLTLARDIFDTLHDWGVGISCAVAKRATDCCQYQSDLRDPQPPQVVVIELESLEQLEKENVSTRQICLIYGWTTRSGEADLNLYQKAKRGEIQPPRTTVQHPRFQRVPSLELVDAVVSAFDARAQATADESALAEAVESDVEEEEELLDE